MPIRPLLRLAMAGACLFFPSTAFSQRDLAPESGGPPPDFPKRIEALEQKHGGRLGVAALNLEDRRLLTHRGDERFALCSTFKLPLAVAVAARVDAGTESWERKIPYGPGDLLAYAPVTGKAENMAAGSLSVSDLCAASMQYSDNTAANLLLATLGGPAGFTRYLRSIGDGISRLDRIEPGLNTNLDGDPRDTTTPAAMVSTMEKLLTGDALSPASRDRIIEWLAGNRTGDKRLRAAMDPAWKTGDKTGTGENGAVNDVAIVWPDGRKPFLVAVYYTGSPAGPEEREQVIAEIGGIIRREFHPE